MAPDIPAITSDFFALQFFVIESYFFAPDIDRNAVAIPIAFGLFCVIKLLILFSSVCSANP